MFIFAYVLNVFNLVFPEACFLITDKQVSIGKWGKRLILYPSIFLPFGWLILIIILLSLKLINDETNKLTLDILCNIKLNTPIGKIRKRKIRRKKCLKR